MLYTANKFRVEATASLYQLDTQTKGCSLRFTVKNTTPSSEIQIYVHGKIGTSPTYRIGLMADSGGKPSGTWLAGGTAYVDSQLNTGWNDLFLNGEADLTAGDIIHIVVKWQSGTINLSNFVTLCKSTPQNLLYPYDSSADANSACTYGDGTYSGWTVDASQPIYLINLSGVWNGNPYHTFGEQIIAGTTQVREKWVISGGDKKITTFGAVIRKNNAGTPSGDLTYDICDSSMNVLRTGTLVVKTVVTETYTWYDVNLSSVLTLTNGSTYYFVLYSAASPTQYVIAWMETSNSVTFYNLSWLGTSGLYGLTTNGRTNWTDYNYYDLTFRVAGWVAVSGYVKDVDVSPVQNVTINYTGETSGSTSTDVNGFYTLDANIGGNYTVTPSYNDWIFVPTNKSYTSIQSPQSNQNFQMGPNCTWWDTSFSYRKRISFGTSHDAVPAGYTFELPLEMGLQKNIATNVFFDEPVGGSAGFSIARQSNNNLWVLYLRPNSSTGNNELWIVKYTYSSQSWGTPYKVSGISQPYDSHYGGSIIADNYDILHIAYGCHDTQVKYRKSNNTNPASASDWSAEESPSGGTGAAYPRIRVDDQNRIYIFFRKHNGSDRGQSGYVRYVQGVGWESFITLVHLTYYGLPNPAVYSPGIIIMNNIIHHSYCPQQNYGSSNQARGIGYIKGTINPDTGNITWTKVNGDSVTIPVDQSSDPILFPIWSGAPPWYGNNNDELAVDNNGYPYIGYHGWSTSLNEEVDPRLVHWNGSSWVIENLGTSVTPNRKAWNGRHKNALVINSTDSKIYLFTLCKPPVYEDSAVVQTSTTITLSNAPQVDGLFKGTYIRDRASNAKRKIIDYVGSTRLATLDSSWSPTGTINVVVSKKWFGAEMAEWRYDGSNWNFKYLTMNSSMGHGLITNKPGFSNGTYAIVRARGRDLIFSEIGQLGGTRLDGDDIRIVYSGTERDRNANFFNFKEGKLYFKCQDQIPTNKSFCQVSQYYVYYGKDNPSLPKDDSDQTYTEHHSFELFANQETIKNKDGWTSGGSGPKVANSISEHTNKIVAGDKSLVVNLSGAERTVGTDLQSYEITAWFVPIEEAHINFALKDVTASKEFRIGIADPDLNPYWEYYDATGWHVTSIPCAYGLMHDIKIIINSSGITAYGDGNLLTSNNTHITVFDNIVISDTIAYWDQILIKKWLASPPLPTAGNEEFVGGGTNYYRTPTVNLGLTTEVAKAWSTSKAVISNEGLSSLESHLINYVRTPTVNLGLTTEVAIVLIFGRDIQSNVGLTSSFAKVGTFYRTPQDSVNLSSSIASFMFFAVDLFDNLGITSSPDKLLTTYRSIADNSGVSSEIAKFTNFIREAESQIGLTSFYSQEGQFYRIPTDNIGLSSLVDKSFLRVIDLSDGIGLTDVVNAWVLFIREPQNNVGITDQLSKTGNFLRDLQNSIGLNSAVLKETSFNRSSSNMISLTSGINVFLGKVINLFDNIGLSSALTLMGAYVRTPQNEVGLASQFNKIGTFYRITTENIGITDLVDARLLLIERNILSNIGITDELSKIISFVRNLSDASGITSSLVKQGTFQRNLSDNIDLFTLTETFKFFNRAVADSVGMTSVLARLLTAQRDLQDAMGLSSLYQQMGTYSRTTQNQINLSSLEQNLFIFYRYLTDNLGLSDQVATIITYAIVVFGEKIFTERYKRLLISSITNLLISEQQKSILTKSKTNKLFTEHYGSITITPPYGTDEGTEFGTRGRVPGTGVGLGTGGKIGEE